MPTAESFRALKPGPVLVGEDTWTLTVHDLGILRVPSGRLEASDPFVNLGEGAVVDIPPGDYPVRVTVADVSEEQDGSHLREAYLSVVLADGEPVGKHSALARGRICGSCRVGSGDLRSLWLRAWPLGTLGRWSPRWLIR